MENTTKSAIQRMLDEEASPSGIEKRRRKDAVAQAMAIALTLTSKVLEGDADKIGSNHTTENVSRYFFDLTDKITEGILKRGQEIEQTKAS